MDQEERKSAVALHSSFDATISNDRSESPFLSDDDDEEKGRSASWYEDLGELSGKKHTLPHLETVEPNLPETVRKQARRAGAVSKTPARPRLRPPGAMKKSANITPSSATKRRRAHWQVNDSPTSRVPPTPLQGRITSPPTTTVKLDGSIFGKYPNESPFSPSPALTPNRQLGFHRTAKSNSKYTGTTASTTVLETTVESSDSVDTSSPTTTRFRFTTFPASLPRVNNPRSREYHDSLRKRMSFGEAASCDANQSRDDDGTQNTSISSLSADGHHHMAPVPGALPPTILDLHPPHNDLEDADSGRPIHAKLFAEDEDFGYSDDDDSQSSPARDIVGRTRLNFNTVLSPDKVGFNPKEAETTIDLMQTYDQRRINSFPSSLSSSTHVNNISSCDMVGGSLTPTRRFSDKYLATLTPREVQVHFPLEDECSPIPGFKGDPTRCEIHESMPTPSDDSEPLSGRTLLSMHTVMETGDSSSNTDSVVKEEMSTGSGSVNGKSRGLRPMPDISAFETNAQSSRGERSSDDSATSDSKGISSTHRLTCPPTPVRTPAWANEGGGHAFFGRQSSLITTKVLLSVPSQVLEGRCSLENSFLDDDSSVGNDGYFSISGQKKTRLENEKYHTLSGGLSARLSVPLHHEPESAVKVPKLQDPPRLMRRVPPGQEIDSIVSFTHDFEILSLLGRGAFADVYKVRSVRDHRLYAVKRNRRQFRGKRDRDMALTEVQAMQRLQRVCGEVGISNSQEKGSYSLYLLFFYRAWQEDGYLLCQTELCSRDTCRELIDSLRLFWNSAKIKYPSLDTYFPSAQLGSIDESLAPSVPNDTVWKICHDIAAGLSHIHSHGMVHYDIKPSNIFFVAHPRFGAMCKIGDFGMAGDIGTSADGLEGDARYMSPELLSSGARQPSSDIFSLGLTIYEIAADIQTEMPSEGPEWHFLRSLHGPILPKERGQELLKLVQEMTDPRESRRPTADDILKRGDVLVAGKRCDRFLQDYLHDIEAFDQKEEERLAMDCQEDQTPRNGSHRIAMPVRSPSLSMLISNPPNLLSPVGKCLH